MRDLLEQIVSLSFLAIPKSVHGPDQISAVFGQVAAETETSWLVPCSHALNQPAEAAQIENTERELGFRILLEYRTFLSIANGAKLLHRPQGHG